MLRAGGEGGRANVFAFQPQRNLGADYNLGLHEIGLISAKGLARWGSLIGATTRTWTWKLNEVRNRIERVLGSSMLTGVLRIIHVPGFAIFTKMAVLLKCTAPANARRGNNHRPSNRIILLSLKGQFSDKIVGCGFENAKEVRRPERQPQHYRPVKCRSHRQPKRIATRNCRNIY
jgi:hypothetical protein